MSVTAYAAAVRAALPDVPAAADLLEDLDEHLAELAADTGPDLVATLGPPAAYADQLRRAADLTVVPRIRPNPFEALGDVVGRIREKQAAREVLAFLPQLRPAWWVLRGWLVIIVLGLLFGGGTWVLLPFGLLGIPLIAAAIVVSVRLARYTLHKPPVDGSRLAALVSNAALTLVSLIVVVGVQQQTEYVYADDSQPVEQTLTTRDGSPITNLFPFSADGEPLSGVLLYDQEGRPVEHLAT